MISLFIKKDSFELLCENFSASNVPGDVQWIKGCTSHRGSTTQKAEKTQELLQRSEVDDKISQPVKDFGDTWHQSASRPHAYFVVFLKEDLGRWHMGVKTCPTLLCLSSWHQLQNSDMCYFRAWMTIGIFTKMLWKVEGSSLFCLRMLSRSLSQYSWAWVMRS